MRRRSKIMRTLVTFLTTVVVFAFVGCSRSKEGDNYTQVASEDAAMNAAIEKAKATADDFVRAFHAQKPSAKDYFAKKPYRTPSGGIEHMWIAVLEEEQGVLKG